MWIVVHMCAAIKNHGKWYIFIYHEEAHTTIEKG